MAPSPAVVQALRRVLRPLVKLMLQNGVTIQYLNELLKRLFVEVADKDFRLDEKPSTDSRVSLLTGVHRKDVSRIRSLSSSEQDDGPSIVPLGTQVVSRWTAQPRYLNDDGSPKALPRMASEGGEVSFEALVSGINSDIRSRVVLDELLRLGVVSLTEQGRVKLNTHAFVPSKGADEKAFYLGHNLGDHACAAVRNVMGQEAPFMERSVHYSGLSAMSIRQLGQMAEHMGMKALLSVNQTAMEAEACDRNDPSEQPVHRMTMGIYFYSERAEDADASASGDEDRA
ncbi:DUF6502 family protein [Hydrogenophaga sp. 5NK40-0174]